MVGDGHVSDERAPRQALRYHSHSRLRPLLRYHRHYSRLRPLLMLTVSTHVQLVDASAYRQIGRYRRSKHRESVISVANNTPL